MIKAGVIGYPVAQSLSPKLHGYWLKEYGIDGEYKAYEVKPEALEDFIRTMSEKGFAGCNVTIPHKEAVINMLDQVDDLATAVGAINTIVIKNGKLCGTNTDVYGFTENIPPHLAGKNKAIVLGAGGAAKGICYGLKQLGFKDITVLNRTPDKAKTIAKYMHIKSDAWENRSNILKSADLLVNTTSLGMVGQPPLEIDLRELPKTALVTDIVYKPLITPLLAAAKARGNPIVDGLGMLLHQAVPGFEAWFGVCPQVTAALREHILSA